MRGYLAAWAIACAPVLLTAPVSAQSIIPNADSTNTQVIQSGNQYDITGGQQSTDGQNLFHSFQTFGLSVGEIANIIAQPEVQNILGRINGGNASVIDGLLQVTGSQANLYLLNPAGVLFGPDATLNLPGSLTATTADGIGLEGGRFDVIGNPDYAALVGQPNTLWFRVVQPGAVVNAGDLQLGDNQTLALVGGTVVNDGTLRSAGGEIAIAAVPGEQLVRLSPTGSILSYEISPETPPGVPAITPLSLPELLTGSDTELTVADDTVQIAQVAIPTEAGTVVVSGRVDASNPDGTGGSLFLLGDTVGVVEGNLQATGATGGNINIGGSQTGQGPLPNAQITYLDANTTADVSSTGQGDGGTIIVWSDTTTQSQGQLAAQGGSLAGFDGGGNGGFVETSSSGYLNVETAPDITAAAGTAGVWLIDPFDIVIDDFAGTSSGFDPANPFTAVASPARLDINTLRSAITDGATVIVTTGTAGTEAGNITLDQALFYDLFEDGATLSLEAAGSIFLNDRIAPLSSGGQPLTLNLLADTNNTGNGQVVINAPVDDFPGSAIDTSGGDLVIQADSTNLGPPAITLADNNNISTVDPFSEFPTGGDITMTGTATGGTGIQLGGALEAGGQIQLSSNQDIEVDTLQATDNITVNTDQLFRATGVITEFDFSDDGMFAETEVGSLQSRTGQVTIEHGGNGEVPFVVGDDATNGTASNILANDSRLEPPASLLGDFIDGDIAILTGEPPEPPEIPETPETPETPTENPDIPGCVADCVNSLPEPPRPELEVFIDEDPTPPLIVERGGDIITAINDLETDYTQSFQNYLGLTGEPFPNPELPRTQEELQLVAENTGIKPAILYVSFVPQSLEISSAQTKQIAQPSDLLELILVTPDSPPVRKTLPVTQAQVIKVADQLRREVSNRSRLRSRTYLRPAQQLHKWFIDPIKTDLTEQEIGNIAFVMAPGLRSLPVSVLHDGTDFLIEHYSVGLMPSIALSDLRYVDVRDSEVLAMGASSFTDQPALPAVPIELTTITEQLWPGDFLLNETFTPDLLIANRERKPYGIVHLATHGEFQAGSVDNSYIQFWDQRLGVDQLRALRLNSPPVELMVLSACRTALGNEEAELGFAGLAVQSGVKTALASLWKVDDVGTAGLMTQFYSSLREEPIKAEALRQAQLAMLRGDIQIKNERLVWSGGEIALPSELFNSAGDFVHPYFWASFTVIGSPW
ncbi:MAG: CHAT domain-containing protein [Cyanobacteria bacterium P01_G01_bin.38]